MINIKVEYIYFYEVWLHFDTDLLVRFMWIIILIGITAVC